MKTKNIQKGFFALICAVLLSACAKESENIFTMFKDVNITFNNSDPRCVTDYKLVNDKDEVWIDFTLTSDKEDMYSYVVETSAGTQQPSRITYAISDETQRRKFSTVLKMTMNRDGKSTYRIYALNAKGIYMGDGYKKVTVDVNPSYTVFVNRDIYLPDSVGKVLPSFMSFVDGSTYSYNTGLANSAKIDFGIYRTMYKDAQGNTLYAVNLYNTSTTVFPIHDFSNWQKRATKFSAPVTSQGTVFTNNAISGSTIETLAKARTITLNNTTATTAAAGLAPGSAVFFQTPEGKYGMMLINNVTSDLDRKPYINVSVKLQR